MKELQGDETAEFHFIQGPYEVAPPEGYEEFFGGAPYFRFIVPEGEEAEKVDVIERIRDFPQLETPEMTMRELMTYGVARTDKSAAHTLKYLYDLMEKEGPFDGIVGYSEGATIAGTLLLHEQLLQENHGRIPMFKFALFFGGWPPMKPTLDGIVLADESELMIDIPTCHISKLTPEIFLVEYETYGEIQLARWILIYMATWPCITFATQILRTSSITLKDTHYREIDTWSRNWET